MTGGVALKRFFPLSAVWHGLYLLAGPEILSLMRAPGPPRFDREKSTGCGTGPARAGSEVHRCHLVADPLPVAGVHAPALPVVGCGRHTWHRHAGHVGADRGATREPVRIRFVAFRWLT
jgi:hypothetical protein